ncbi:uncharacterized protein EI97DRAFT_466954 [Westerdykella ornata]|uniref:Autophagy-related protein 27 n=1 Tax=Westerdykella ornata TaxID=318751 RepID=A0A6A6JJR9_WESOR|nr:uncharacterized protein EI97DRAFT_466954 [Westerdykella ornata]KAF2276841.1 hypothetical protein EI97DRAFT_466954 [Westerdykella ornata]
MSHYRTSPSTRSQPSSTLISLTTLSFLLLGLPSPSSAFDCKDIVAGKVNFNFKDLGGPRIVHWDEDPDWAHETQYKYNFTIDICNKLPLKGDKQRDCPSGTRICAIREQYDLGGGGNATIQAIPIAGTYKLQTGREIDAKFSLLRDSKSNTDVGREGVRAELHGGRYPFDDKKGMDQQAIIEFVCDRERTGLEGEELDKGEKKQDDKKDDKGGDEKKGDSEDGKKGEEKDGRLRKREGEDGEDDEKKDASLRFVSYKVEEGEKEKKVHTLRLEWRTKYACEDAPEPEASSHWGFFTWFIIIVFLLTAAYLIFGSWLNYNRYGARGWDLLPHGDTIRDIPYILKDCARRVKDTVQGPGGRGGYSAV